jgi:hypothetical protein
MFTLAYRYDNTFEFSFWGTNYLRSGATSADSGSWLHWSGIYIYIYIYL